MSDPVTEHAQKLSVPGDVAPRRASRGQVVVVFAGAMLVFVLLAATVIDLSWYWTNNLRMQRAADAAALAGVVFLPDKLSNAVSAARAEATKNGYEHGVNGVVVTPIRDPDNDRRLFVTITGAVDTYFARAVGIRSFPATRTAKADYILPVPMGSPENYYGVFGKLRTPGGGIDVANPPVNAATSWFSPSSDDPNSGNWTDPANAFQPQLSGTVEAATKDDLGPGGSSFQAWGAFGVMLPNPPASPGTEQSFVVDGIELSVRAEASDATGCELLASLTWDASGASSGNWTAPRTIPLNGAYDYVEVGGGSDTWGRAWGRGELDDSSFRIRLQRFDPDPGNGVCDDDFTSSVDHLRVRVFWTQVTTTFVPDTNLAGPGGEALTPRGFWGTMLTQGADDINGDAYLPNYEGGSTINTEYEPDRYYDYGVDMTASSGGSVYIFDPVFCATSSAGQFGTGDRWFGSQTPTSSWYELWDTANTPFSLDDDVRVDPTGDDDLFANVQASDTTLGGPAVSGGTSSCAKGATSNQGDGRYWHNRWWPLATGLPGGTTYRVRTRTTDPNNGSAQSNADGENSFAIWTSAASGPFPKVFGIGAMQAFSPLPGDETSEFYLAQIDDVHAGKTVVISLYDPGDTGNLTGKLSILVPSASGYSSADLTWRSAKGTRHGSASNCDGLSGTGRVIDTHNPAQRFNGCWVTIEVALPAGYSTAIAPPGEAEAGWWKIRYTMAGSALDTSLDVTTWQVDIRGNPVHLVLP